MPLPPSTDWRETVGEDETARFDALAATLAGIQRARSERHPMGRALHYKPHAGLLAEFTVHDDVPTWAQVGIFAAPGRFPAYVRYSNGSGAFQPDTEPDVRGIAVKLVGVPGTKIIHPDAKTQDFLAILSPSVPFATPEEFVGLVQAVSGHKLLALPRLLGHFGLRLGKVLGKLKEGLGTRVDSLAAPTFYSALPIRWGDYAVKYSFVPAAPAKADRVTTPDGYRDELAGRLARGGLSYAFRVQPYVDPAQTPVEDNTVEWLEADSPWVTVATLDIPRVEADGQPEGLADFVESLVFDPWHAPTEFRPLGAMQRARNHAYRDSSITRGAAPEPDGTEAWLNPS